MDNEVRLPSGQAHRILIVDDVPFKLGFLIAYLSQAGFEVLVARDGQTAIREAKQAQPDIILLDVLMPNMDGFETCRFLKNDRATKEIPVIFMTAVSGVGSKVEGFGLGAVDYVTKPIDPQEVLARIMTHVTLRGLQRNLQNEITEHKKTEAKLREYAAILQARNDELDAFAHTVAHNLKNPLGALASLAEVMQFEHTSMTNEELDDCLKLLWRGGHKAINIIDELLLLASVRKQDITPVPLNMAEIISDSQQRLADLIKQSKTRLVLPNDWPMALGYAPWIEEVWVNYLSNAIKYGGCPPYVELGATVQEDNQVRFWIRDNGPGLTPTEQDQLFVPFSRLGKGDVQGYGLGLSIVRRIIEKLNGEVGIESNGLPGHGCMFNFTLPVAVS